LGDRETDDELLPWEEGPVEETSEALLRHSVLARPGV
jgi:hypothetical protein